MESPDLEGVWQYDDGEAHWESFTRARWEYEPEDDETNDAVGARRGCRRGRKRAVLEEPLLSRRLAMWWPAEQEWFHGTICKFHSSGQHIIEWDDGEVSIHDLSAERFRWIAAYQQLQIASCQQSHGGDVAGPDAAHEDMQDAVRLLALARGNLGLELPTPRINWYTSFGGRGHDFTSEHRQDVCHDGRWSGQEPAHAGLGQSVVAGGAAPGLDELCMPPGLEELC